jgi:hypothetical protein
MLLAQADVRQPIAADGCSSLFAQAPGKAIYDKSRAGIQRAASPRVYPWVTDERVSFRSDATGDAEPT